MTDRAQMNTQNGDVDNHVREIMTMLSALPYGRDVSREDQERRADLDAAHAISRHVIGKISITDQSA